MPGYVLVVDDEVQTSDFLIEFIGSLGYPAVPAYDGHAALETMRADPPGLALVDLRLPGRGGFELIRHMRAEPPLAGIPILVCPARREARVPADIVHGVIYKPFDVVEVGRQVQA